MKPSRKSWRGKERRRGKEMRTDKETEGKKRGYLIQQAPTWPSAHQTRQLNWASESTQTHAHTHTEQRANKIQQTQTLALSQLSTRKAGGV